MEITIWINVKTINKLIICLINKGKKVDDEFNN